MRSSRKPCCASRSAARARSARRLAATLAFALSAALMPMTGANAAPGESVRSLIVTRPDAEVLLLAVKLDDKVLSDGLAAWADGGDVLLPLGQLCGLLDLAITTDVARGSATGFFLDEQRRFDLDVVSQRVIVDGKPRRFERAAIEVHEDDIYVRAGLIAEWLPLRFDIDLYGSFVVVRAVERLPLEQRLDRERRIEATRANQNRQQPHYPLHPLPYRLLDGVFVDQDLRYQRLPNPGGDPTSALQYSTNLSGDLLYMEANAFVSGTDRGVADSRFSLARKDPEGRLLGRLQVRELTLGDVFYPGLDLVATPRSGPGILVSSFPLSSPSQFDRESFRGDLPPGWEIELYRNGELLAFARARADGLYEFLDVPLLFGMNIFRLEHYGPQGQRRSETRFLNIGQSLTPPGKLYYRLVGSDPGARLLGETTPDNRAAASFELNAGLLRNLTATASVASVERADGQRTYAKLGLRGFWGWLFANADYAAAPNGGSALQATLQSRLGAFGLLFQHSELRDYTSEVFASDTAGPLRRRTLLRIDTAIPASFLPRLPVSFEFREDRLVNGRRADRLLARISASRRGFFISNQVNWSLFPGGGETFPANAFGQLLASQLLGAVAVRGELDYQIRPNGEVSYLTLTLERHLGRGTYLASAALTRAFREGQSRLAAGISRLQGPLGFGLAAEYSDPGGFGLTASLTVGIGRDARTGRWHTQARTMASLGALSARVFLDRNGNGSLEDGEQPLSGVGILLNGSSSSAVTDDLGEAFLANLNPYQRVDVSISPSTLEDPYSKPSREGEGLIPRPGTTALLDFPVVIYGNITGTVVLVREGRRAPVGAVTVELADAAGRVAKRVRSAYDGFFELADLKPGRYTLRIGEVSLERLRVQTPPAPREIELAPGGTVLEGITLELVVP